MKTWWIIGTALLVGTVQAWAALPPHYQRQAELTAIIEAATETLGIGNVVDGITMTATDHWVVTSGACRLEIRIVDVPRSEEPGFAGPRNFAVETGAVACP